MKHLTPLLFLAACSLFAAGCGPSADEHVEEMRLTVSEVLTLTKSATDAASAHAAKDRLLEANERFQKLVMSGDRSLRNDAEFSRLFDQEVTPMLDELHSEVRRIRASKEFGSILFEFTDTFKGVK